MHLSEQSDLEDSIVGLKRLLAAQREDTELLTKQYQEKCKKEKDLEHANATLQVPDCFATCDWQGLSSW